jgi:hypothetical protein
MPLHSQTCGRAILGSLLLLSTPQARSDDLLERVRAGNTSAIQSIRTFSCRITVSQTGFNQPGQTQSNTYKGQYWRSEQGIRCHYESQGRSSAQILQNGNRRISLEPGRAAMTRIGGINQASDSKLGDCDVWMFALLTFTSPDNTLLSFAALLNKPHKIRKLRRESEAGTELIYYLELEIDNVCCIAVG